MNNHSPVADADQLPGDDTSVANFLAKRYEDMGLDPRAAYDNPDDAIADFGGPTAFL